MTDPATTRKIFDQIEVLQDELETLTRQLGLKAEIKPFLYRRGFDAKGIDPLKNAVEAAHQEVLGKTSEAPGTTECSTWRDRNPYNELDIPSLTYGCGGGAGDGNVCFSVEDMITAAKVYALGAVTVCNSPI